MKFTSIAAAASLAISATALPTACNAPATPETFGIVAIHSGSGVQYSGFNAALGSLFAGLPKQNATCEGPDSGFATFYVKDEALFLYGPSNSTQQFFVDRSGMGQGVIGYTSNVQSTPRYGELTGWAINKDNHLQFAGNDFIACPNSIGGAFSVWADAGVSNPGWNEGCVGIAARVERIGTPTRCTYSS